MSNLVVAKDGVRVRLESPCLEGWIEPKNLDDLRTYAARDLPKDKFPGPKWIGAKMPTELVQKVLGTIHEFPHTETAYVLYYNPIEKKWAIKCPEQSGGGAAVSFEDDGTGMPEGYLITGSIHTHPEMGAFWSGTDLNDQQFKAGLHIVFGLHDGLVTQSKCTVFMPNAQEDQNLWDVLEETDFTKVYEPVAEWVETIKKQSYRRVVVQKWYGGHTSVQHKPLPAGHYGTVANSYAGYNNYRFNSPGYNYGDYTYGGQKKNNWYGSSWYNWAGWDTSWDADGYDDVYDYDPKAVTKTEASTAAALVETNLRKCLSDKDNAAYLADVLLDADIIGKLEQYTGIVITDSFDKNDVLLTIEGLMTGNTVLTEMTDDEARQIFEGLVDLKPELKIVDPDNALGNDVNVGALVDIITGVVESYSMSDCISGDMLDCLLITMKEAYESLLQLKAAYDNPTTESEETNA